MQKLDLPQIMVAPNGARRLRSDHPAIPLTIAETVNTAFECYDAGARAIHAHVRDGDGKHVLDAGMYRELITELASSVPDMLVQITTEAVGVYNSDQQRELVRSVMPKFVSIALKEIIDGTDENTVRKFFAWTKESNISVQHILYTSHELQKFIEFVARGVIPEQQVEALFVLGRYTKGQQSSPQNISPFLDVRDAGLKNLSWSVCAFGKRETDCLAYAASKGGKTRIGFENNLHNRDGDVASSNADRVRELVSTLRAAGTLQEPTG